MKNKCLVVLLVAVMLLSSACGGNTASNKNKNYITSVETEYPYYDSAKELVESADLIFSGTVKEIHYKNLDVGNGNELDEKVAIPYILYDIEIDKVFKGNYDEKEITIKMAKAENENRNATSISRDKPYLFLTETYKDSYPSLLNDSQASYLLDGQRKISIGNVDNNEITLSDVMKELEK